MADFLISQTVLLFTGYINHTHTHAHILLCSPLARFLNYKLVSQFSFRLRQLQLMHLNPNYLQSTTGGNTADPCIFQ